MNELHSKCIGIKFLDGQWMIIPLHLSETLVSTDPGFPPSVRIGGMDFEFTKFTKSGRALYHER